jgi:hypothetical protein
LSAGLSMRWFDKLLITVIRFVPIFPPILEAYFRFRGSLWFSSPSFEVARHPNFSSVVASSMNPRIFVEWITNVPSHFFCWNKNDAVNFANTPRLTRLGL